MRKREAHKEFSRDYTSDIKTTEQTNGYGADRQMRCKKWREFTEKLWMSGRISEKQHREWDFPPFCKLA